MLGWRLMAASFVIFLTVILSLICIFLQVEYINTKLDLLRPSDQKY